MRNSVDERIKQDGPPIKLLFQRYGLSPKLRRSLESAIFARPKTQVKGFFLNFAVEMSANSSTVASFHGPCFLWLR